MRTRPLRNKLHLQSPADRWLGEGAEKLDSLTTTTYVTRSVVNINLFLQDDSLRPFLCHWTSISQTPYRALAYSKTQMLS